MARDRLNEQDATELLSRISDLSATTADLSSGLRAAAQEANSIQLNRMMNRMADRLDSGMSLADAINASSSGLPKFVSGIVRIGLETGNLRKLLVEFVAEHQRAREVWRHVRFSLTYPILLVILSCAVCGFILLVAAPIIQATVEEFELQVQDEIVNVGKLVTWFSDGGFVKLGGAMGILIFLLLVAALFGGRRFLYQFFGTMPAFGKLLQWQAYAEFARLLQMTIEQDVPLPKALDLVSHGLRNPFVAHLTKTMAARSESGQSLTATVDQTAHVPGIVAGAIRWGEESGDLVAALETLHEMLYSAIRVRSDLLSRVLPPVILVLVAGLVLTVASALLLPLFSLIQYIS